MQMKHLTLNKEYSYTTTSQNMIIHGDCGQVLPSIKEFFASKIRCIYIDPPYNNGDRYKYYSDHRSHEEWISTMRQILTELRDYLADDGSIWVSIDDTEVCHLRLLMEEVFHPTNFVATIIWQQRTTRENRSIFSYDHEYLLVFAKSIKSFKKSRNLLPYIDDTILSRYQNPDNDPRGPWQSITANVQAGHAVASQFYTITAPNGSKHDPPKGRCWVYNQSKMEEQIRLNNIWFGKTGNNAPRIKKFLKDAKIGLTPHTLWTSDEVGTTDSAKKHLMSILATDNIFETPKPEELIHRILTIATNPGEYVLDCFLGSGTTAAVAHKMNRHYIGIEIGEQAKTLVPKRLNEVIKGEPGGCSLVCNWAGGGDFTYYDFTE